MDFLGRVTFTLSDRTSFIFVMTEGPEFSAGVGRGLPNGDNSHWWTALDLVATHKMTDNLNLGLGVDYVNTPHIPGLRGHLTMSLSHIHVLTCSLLIDAD